MLNPSGVLKIFRSFVPRIVSGAASPPTTQDSSTDSACPVSNDYRVTTHHSPLTTIDYRLPTSDSQLITHHSRLSTIESRLTTPDYRLSTLSPLPHILSLLISTAYTFSIPSKFARKITHLPSGLKCTFGSSLYP